MAQDPLRVRLNHAFLKAFGNEEELERMTSLWLNVPLEEIAKGDNLKLLVFNLIDWAERNDRVEDLVRAALADNPNNQALRDVSNEIGLSAITRDQTVTVAVVVAAMTVTEAQELDSLKVFDSQGVAPIERQRFQMFRQVLKEKHDIVDLLAYYGEKRESWKPQGDQPISQIIDDTVARLNKQASEEVPPGLQLRVQPVSSVFFAEQSPTRTEVWRSVRQLGYILIIDAVSLFHPLLRNRLLQSQIGPAEQPVSLIVLSPISPRLLPGNKIWEEEMGTPLEWAFVRFNQEFDLRCELGVGDLVVMQRWMTAMLKQTLQARKTWQPNPAALKRLRSVIGGEISTNGRMVQLVSGDAETNWGNN